jgi:hypothetical protein
MFDCFMVCVSTSLVFVITYLNSVCSSDVILVFSAF